MHAPRDILEIFLQPGEFYFGEERTRIRTLLGSCVAITLWHPKLHIGGMSHYMLSSRPRPKKDETLNGRYAVEVMEMFMRELKRSHTKPREYQVKIFGGGCMFEHRGKEGKARNTIGISERNVRAGRELVTRYGFTFAAEDLGGNGHRNVVLDLWSGDVWVKKTTKALATV
jgi:chemotaxis protein CheD